MRFWLKAFLC